MRRRGIVCVEIPNQNLRSACVRQESCHAAIRRRKLLKLRRRNRAAVAGRMANGCFSGRTANRKKWVIEKKPGEQKTHKNLPQRDSTGPHCVAREVHCSWFDTSTPSLTTRCANRMPSVFVFVKSLPELEKKTRSGLLALLVAGRRVCNPLRTTRVPSPRATLYALFLSVKRTRSPATIVSGLSGGVLPRASSSISAFLSGTAPLTRSDKIDAHSLAIVGHVFAGSLRELEKKFRRAISRDHCLGEEGDHRQGSDNPRGRFIH
jgi:hypothetical protein